MTHQPHPQPPAPGADPGRQIAQLRQALQLVEALAAGRAAPPPDAALDEAARIGGAYEKALPVVQRRFDALAAETADWAAAGVEARLAAESPSRAAAARLAAEMEAALARISGLLKG